MTELPTNDETVKTIIIRYLEFDTATANDLVRASFTDATLVDRLLQRLSITRAPGEGALRAWTRAMAHENGLPHTVPCHPAITQAINENPAAQRWAWILA